MISEALVTVIKNHYMLSWDGIHGISHWTRVWKIGSILAAKTSADIKVVEAFAFLHDSCRISDRGDSGHGLRAAILAEQLNSRYIKLDADQLKHLQWACAHHDSGKISSNATIGTCWDADRLDLGRAGILPDAEYLSTDAAKQAYFIEWAYKQSCEESCSDC